MDGHRQAAGTEAHQDGPERERPREDDGHRHVARGVGPVDERLDAERGDDGDTERAHLRGDRHLERRPEEQAECDPRERGVGERVADERHPPVDEERPDQRRDDADADARQQRELHVPLAGHTADRRTADGTGGVAEQAEEGVERPFDRAEDECEHRDVSRRAGHGWSWACSCS